MKPRGKERTNLKIFRKVKMLHREVHGALETLVASIDDLPGKAAQSLLDVQIIIRVKEIVVSKPYQPYRSNIQIRNVPKFGIIIRVLRERKANRICGAELRRLSCAGRRASSSLDPTVPAKKTPLLELFDRIVWRWIFGSRSIGD